MSLEFSGKFWDKDLNIGEISAYMVCEAMRPAEMNKGLSFDGVEA